MKVRRDSRRGKLRVRQASVGTRQQRNHKIDIAPRGGEVNLVPDLAILRASERGRNAQAKQQSC
jgi:hypothetical protein